MPTRYENLLKKLFTGGKHDTEKRMIISKDHTYAAMFFEDNDTYTDVCGGIDCEETTCLKLDVFKNHKITGAEFDLRRLKNAIDFLSDVEETEVRIFMSHEKEFPIQIYGVKTKVSFLFAPRLANEDGVFQETVDLHNAQVEKATKKAKK